MEASTNQSRLRVAGRDPAALASAEPVEPFWAPVTIRIATAGDGPALELLADLDSAPAPAGTVLIGVVRGRALAALSLEDGQEIADPFSATTDILELLRLRAGQLRSSRRRSRPRLRPTG